MLLVINSPFNEKRLHCFLTGERYNNAILKPTISKVVNGERVANDKLIIVRGTTKYKLDEDIKDVCDTYNGNGGKMYPEIQRLGYMVFAVTFPYDIDFESFCYLINSIYYPSSGGDRAEVTGWTKAVAGDLWITPEIAGKQLMIYLSEEDKWHNNVYVTTENDECYKFSFDEGTSSPAELCRHYQGPDNLFPLNFTPLRDADR